MYAFLTVAGWADYELIDAGNFEKLERFGQYILARPEPQAIWNKHLPESEWNRLAQAVFKKEKGSSEKGQWVLKKGMPEQWFISYNYKDMKLRFRLGLSSFKHVGIFPEQDPNWQFIYDHGQRLKTKQPKILNMFAYTGAASLAAKATGAEVTHLDSVKVVNYWARENMEASNLDNIRWLVEDAMKFARREVKRGNKYQGLILDPPAYGRGPNGEKWQLEDELNELVKLCGELLDPADHFFLINLYSLGFSAFILENLINQTFNLNADTFKQFGELYLQDRGNRKLPLGTFYRFSSVSTEK